MHNANGLPGWGPPEKDPDAYKSDPQAAFARAKASACPNAPSRYCWDLVSGRVIQLSCKSWGCSRCGYFKQQAAHRALLEGTQQALARGEWVRFFTLTAPSKNMSIEDVYKAFNRVRARLRRCTKKHPLPRLREYAAVLEWQARGAPHLHVIATGEYIPQAELSKIARAAGFGQVVDIRAVGGPGHSDAEQGEDDRAQRAARYLAKYMAKAEKHALKAQKTAAKKAAAAARKSGEDALPLRRTRPARFSRGWGCSMGEATDLLLREWLESVGRDAGERCHWVLLEADEADGKLTVLGCGRRLHKMDLLMLLDDLRWDPPAPEPAEVPEWWDADPPSVAAPPGPLITAFTPPDQLELGIYSRQGREEVVPDWFMA